MNETVSPHEDEQPNEPRFLDSQIAQLTTHLQDRYKDGALTYNEALPDALSFVSNRISIAAHDSALINNTQETDPISLQAREDMQEDVRRYAEILLRAADGDMTGILTIIDKEIDVESAEEEPRLEYVTALRNFKASLSQPRT